MPFSKRPKTGIVGPKKNSQNTPVWNGNGKFSKEFFMSSGCADCSGNLIFYPIAYPAVMVFISCMRLLQSIYFCYVHWRGDHNNWQFLWRNDGVLFAYRQSRTWSSAIINRSLTALTRSSRVTIFPTEPLQHGWVHMPLNKDIYYLLHPCIGHRLDRLHRLVVTQFKLVRLHRRNRLKWRNSWCHSHPHWSHLWRNREPED